MLFQLYCSDNQITSLNLNNNTQLDEVHCSNNQLTTLDVSNSIILYALDCDNNNLFSLDLSSNTDLSFLDCDSNQLTLLDIRNGNNQNMDMWSFSCISNPNLNCINVDDSTYSANNWTVVNGNIDAQNYFSNNCSGTTSIEDHTTNKVLIKITDILGRETKRNKNEPLFYIYDDRTVEKKIIIE
tara:strand:- start:14 stop:565 length:552 start_codon:yes stop_codon:yes gene_type:complete